MKINLKNPTWITDGMAIMMLCALFSSCSNEDFLGEKDSAESCDKICFGLTSGSEAATRGLCDAQQEAYTDSRFVLRSEGSSDSLCLRAVVTDGIYSSQQQEQQAITRGLPVTGINDFHNKFHVLAYWSRNNTLMNTFFMNEDATNNGSNLWSTERIYYWPGAEHTLQFCAWAPSDATNLVAPSTPQSKQMTYTVPSEATDQKDILVALTEEIDGTNKSTAVPLSFKHICSQIRFVVGSEMQPGTIQSVALKNVAGSGTYDMTAESWVLSTETTNFTQTLNKTTTGNEQSGDAITTNEGTFMMLPQTLGSTAQVEVVFLKENSETRTLTASIADTQWPMGKTVTYRLSISPEYELEFSDDNPTEADAHYVIIPIKINASNLGNGTYTLKSSSPEICKLRANLIGPETQGYWPKEDACENDFVRVEAITSSEEASEVVYYAFLSENATDSDRDVVLELLYNDKTIRTWSINQKCPNWMSDGSMGWEHMEEDGEKPFGFAWTRKVTYKPSGLWGYVIFNIYYYLGRFSSNEAVTFSGYLIKNGCTIDYSKVQSLSNVFSDTDGLSNTKGFRANSASDLSSMENTLRDICTYEESGENINSVDFAALICIKKNACSKVEKNTQQEQTAYLPSFTEEDIKWYLPAYGEFTTEAGLNGQYWSSTAIDDNTYAYSWQNSAIQTPRMENHKVRAARVKE